MSLTGKVINADVDNVYYEVSVPNTRTDYIPAAFNETRVEPVLSDSNDWQLLITDFNLPASGIPLFLFEDASVPPDFSSGYWISGEYLTGIKYSPVLYSPLQTTTKNTGSLPPFPYNRAIYDYTLFVDQINRAFVNLWAQFTPAFTTAAPFIYYNPESGLFSLYCDAIDLPRMYNGSNYAVAIKIYFNYKLQKFFKWPSQFQGSPLTIPEAPLDYLIMWSRRNVRVIPVSPFPPPVNGTLIELKQEFSTISKWMRYTKILFNSSSIPVMNRQVGDVASAGNNQNFSILTSYELADGELFDRSNISFNSTSANRWISMLPSGPVRTFDVNVLFMGATSNDILPAYIAPGEKFSLTIWFNRKVKRTSDGDVLRAINNLGPSLERVVERMAKAAMEEREAAEIEDALRQKPMRIVPKTGARRGKLL